MRDAPGRLKADARAERALFLARTTPLVCAPRVSMRTVVLATSYPSSPDDASGHFVRAEALSLARAGHDVHVVAPCPYRGDAGVTTHAAGGDTLFTWPGAAARVHGSPSRLLAAAPFALRAAAHVRRLQPGRVVAHWLLPCAVPLAALSAPNAHLDVVCHGADVRLLLHIPPPARAAALAHLLRRGASFRFVASSLRDALRAALPARLSAALARASHVAPPHVDTGDLTRPAPSEFAYVASVGRLVTSKRVDLAVRAMALMPPALHLAVLGDGPERLRLEGLARAEAPGRVHFLGRLPRPLSLGWVAAARALVHASEIEAAPTAVLEALALGVPVVACRSGDTAGWAGVQVAERDPGAIARALSRVASTDGASTVATTLGGLPERFAPTLPIAGAWLPSHRLGRGCGEALTHTHAGGCRAC